MSDPTLGFNVETGKLDQASQSLDKVTSSAEKTEAQANKTSDALNKMGTSASGEGMAKAAQSADQLAASLVKTSSESQKALNVSAALDAIVAKTGASYTQANAALAAAVAAHKASTEAVSSHTAALEGLAGAAGGVVPPLGGIAQAASAGGFSLGALASSAGMASIGIGVAAVAFNIASIAMAKIGDEADRAKSRLSAITGSVAAGAASFDLIKQSALSTGTQFNTLASAVEKAVQGVDKMRTGGALVISLDANKIQGDIDRVTDMFTTLDKVMRNAGATSQQQSQVLGALGSGIQKTGGLTLDTFQKIRDTVPEVSRAIASAFGTTDINEFEKALARQPITLTDLENALKRINTQRPDALLTWDQATSDLGIAWHNLLNDLASTGAFNVVKGAVEGVASVVRQATQDFENYAAAVRNAVAAGGQAAPAISGPASSSFGGMGPEMFGQQAPGGDPFSFNNSSFINQSAADSLSHFASGGSFVVGGTGGTDSQLIQFMASPGEQVTIGQAGTGTGSGTAQTLGALLPVSTADAGSTAPTDLMSAHFADDLKTQTAALSDRINASRDAIVTAVNNSTAKTVAATSATTVATAPTGGAPSVASGGGGSSSSSSGGGGGGIGGFKNEKSLPPSQGNNTPISPQQFANNPNYGTANKGTQTPIRMATNKGASSDAKVISPNTAQNPVTPLDQVMASAAQDTGSAVTSWPGLGTAQSTFFDTHPAVTTAGNFPAVASPLDTARQFMGGPSSPFGMPNGNDIGGAFGAGPEVVRQQTQTLKESQTQGSKTVADAVKTQTDDTKAIGEKTNSSLGDVQTATEDSLKSLDTANQTAVAGNDATVTGFAATHSALDSVEQAGQATADGVGQTTQAVSSGSGSIVQSVMEAASQIASAVAGAVQSASASSANAASSNGNSNFGSNSGDSSSGGGMSVGGGSDFSGGGVDTGSTGFDSGGVIGFASGGQFTVAGGGGVDTNHVQFMASAGEVVTITPVGGEPPHDPSKGSAPGSKTFAGKPIAAYASGGQFAVGDAVPDPFHDTLTLGEALGAPGNPGASADLISAHIHEYLREQTVTLKDAIAANASKISGAVLTEFAKVSTALSGLSQQISAAASSASVASTRSSSGGGGSSGGTGSFNAFNGGGDMPVGVAHDSFGQATPGYYRTASGAIVPLVQYPPGMGFNQNVAGTGGNQNLGMVSPFGGMAEGGTFVVPGGTSGNDSVEVGIKASPGERIVVLPPEKAEQFRHLASTIKINPEPLSKFLPDTAMMAPGASVPTPWHDTLSYSDAIPGSSYRPMPSLMPEASRAVATGRGRSASSAGASGPDRNVSMNFYLQDRQQADQFIKSRSELARVGRAMLG